MPCWVPIDRLIANAQHYVEERPNDPLGYYTLARLHYLAFAENAIIVPAIYQYNEKGQKPNLPTIEDPWPRAERQRYVQRMEAIRRTLEEFGLGSTYDVTGDTSKAFWDRVDTIQRELKASGWQPKPMPLDEALGHFALAHWNFHRALMLSPKDPLIVLGLASLLDQYLQLLCQESAVSMPRELGTISLDQVRRLYLMAYNLAVSKDLEHKVILRGHLEKLVSYEAGTGYIRLWQKERSIPLGVRLTIARIKSTLKTLEARERAITPIIISLEPSDSISDLLDPDITVAFDLDGDGIPEKTTWVRPTTGILVWDPGHKGNIASGRQLFGSVTWWMFFPDGYRALDLLDDNRDGWLEGKELEGLGVWFDRNSDGKSNAREVIPIAQTQIQAIATRPTGRDGQALVCRTGLRLRDGRILPTYDWLARPAATDRPASTPGSFLPWNW
jgi:hypothetical protein